MSDIEIYARGLVCCSVCAPADMPKDEIKAQVNKENPTGIESQWDFSEDPTFKGGEPNPAPCNRGLGRLHYLMNC